MAKELAMIRRRFTFGRAALAAAVLATVAGGIPAQAHGIWFAQRGKQLAMIYGVGADDLDMVKRLPKVKSVQGYDAEWNPVAANLQPAGLVPIVNSEAPITAVTAVLDNGIWSKDKSGEYHQMGLDQMPDAVVSERTIKYAVHLVGLADRPADFKGTIDARIPVMADQRLQIIPVDGQIPGDMGKPLTVKVLFDGKPMPGVKIHTDFVNDPDQNGPRTDAKGLVTFPVRNQGLNVVGATYRGPSEEPKLYKEVEYFATLSFKLPHLPE
jgi:nickel transport protein